LLLFETTKASLFMKKLKLSLLTLAVVIGVAGAVASKASGTAYYWFEYNEDGSALVDPSAPPTMSVTDPFGCSGSTTNCSAAYSSYQKSGSVYVPAGSLHIIDSKD